MKCNCCGRPITLATRSPEHVYRLPVFEVIEWNGQRAAQRIGWRSAAVCAVCVEHIHAAAERRRAAQHVGNLTKPAIEAVIYVSEG